MQDDSADICAVCRLPVSASVVVLYAVDAIKAVTHFGDQLVDCRDCHFASMVGKAVELSIRNQEDI
jgi:hypothetical protein